METLTLDFQILRRYIDGSGNRLYTLLDLRPEGMSEGYRVFDVTEAEFAALNEEFNII